MAQVDARDGK